MQRRWVLLAAIGCSLVALAMCVVALVVLDKPHFGWLVGTWFLVAITSGVMIGALALLVSALMLPERRTWRGWTLITWAAIALVSPAFGYMFLLPWSLLLATSPLIIVILVTLFRAVERRRPAG